MALASPGPSSTSDAATTGDAGVELLVVLDALVINRFFDFGSGFAKAIFEEAKYAKDSSGAAIEEESRARLLAERSDPLLAFLLDDSCSSSSISSGARSPDDSIHSELTRRTGFFSS